MTDDLLPALDRIARAAVGLTSASLVFGDRADLTLVQWRALAVLADVGQPVRVGEVAVRLGMSLSSTSRLVRRLERHGLASSERDERDRRATIVRPTEAGMALRDAVVEHRREAMARLLQGRPLPDDLRGGLIALAAAFDGLD